MKTADPELMRAINRALVLGTIRRAGPISRVEIGDTTGLSPTTVSAITTALLDDQLILVRHSGSLRNGAGRGRPRVDLMINPDAAYVVGAKIAANRMVFVVSNFQGDALASLVLPVRVDRLPVEVITDLVEDGVRRCVLDAGMTLRDIKTVALCLPGIIEHGSGRVRSSRIFSEANISLTDAIKARLGIDTIIESDANAITMASYWFGRARNCEDFVLVSLEEQINLSVMHEGQLFRGAQQLSLTLGDMAMGTEAGQPIRLGDVASERAILEQADYDPQVQEAMMFGHAMTRVRKMLDNGDNRIGAPVERAGAALGVAIANLVGLFAPPLVLLVGSCTALGDYLLSPLRKALTEVVSPSLENVAEIVVAEAPDELWARGAAAVALSELYGAPWSTTGPARGAGQQ